MSEPASRPSLPVWLARRPGPLLLGVCAGFIACCLAGRLAARQQPFHKFVRFHQGMAPDTHFYPSFSQTLNLAREHVRPGKTLVLVGGNSILQGVGQRAEFIWTKALQQELGDEFEILNLAMRGSFPNEFASLIAERLVADGVPLVFVTIGTVSTNWTCDWDGENYRWLFWDGWGKGLLPDDERRNEWLSQGFDARYGQNEAMQERRRRGQVDAVTYADDLWNYIAFRHVATLWTKIKGVPFWVPYGRIVDPDRGDLIPVQRRFPEANFAFEARVLRAAFSTQAAVDLQRATGGDLVRQEYENFLPRILRDCSLYVFRLEATQYRSLLTDEEQTKYIQTYQGFRQALEDGGLHAVLVGEDFTDEDYFDRSHISETGGRKLARDLAPAIRELRDRLAAGRQTQTPGAAP